ncbi:hypothetical protein CWB99_13525 [Pseudoalteromonas rubra]|uniref:Uncharacterized protein n=2 Tax=Pseudoalteromonas rubra TaxID=43658 RepID=A0A5S3WLT8_9GAMM|nr:hypothetical protein CWB99_13525 [Pseudoalteromonas rubra]TMP31108.1 hypothetical protein CWC00_14765 [Pseudoalteromonas rubra]
MALSLTACGGGSDNKDPNTSSVEDNKISYTELPNFINVKEGEKVTLSLNTSGANASNLNFTWTVRGVDGDVPFTGQGTDTITFTAPEVTQQSSLSISVKLNTSNVIGFVDQHSSVSVADTNSNTVTPQPDTGSVVEELDLSVLVSGSTWMETVHQYIKTPRTEGGYDHTTVKVSRPFDIVSFDQSEHTFSAQVCGEQQSTNVKVDDFFANTDCTEGTKSTVLTQGQDSFTITKMCGDDVAATSTFKQVSENTQTSFGKLAVNFANYPQLAETNQLCGIIATSHVEAKDGNGQTLTSADATVVRLVSQYEGSPFELSFTFGGEPSDSFASLSSVGTGNFAQLETSLYPEISQLKSDSGMLRLDWDNTDTHIKAEFNFDLPLSTFEDEEVTGNFELKLD